MELRSKVSAVSEAVNKEITVCAVPALGKMAPEAIIM
jgi:hypothetical protein